MEDRKAPRRRNLDDSNSERRWDELFRRSPELLEKLADEAIAEYEAGLTKPLGPEKR